MKRIHESRNSVIELDTESRLLYKTLKHREVSDDWLHNYNLVRNDNSMYVKVHNVIDNKTFTMDYIDAIGDLEYIIKDPSNWQMIDKDFVIQSIQSYTNAYLDGLRVSKNRTDKHYFMHTDLTLDNILVDNNKQIRIIDPDSYTWVPNLQWTEKYYITHINMMFCLQRYFYEHV